jgi:hypothetical protein
MKDLRVGLEAHRDDRRDGAGQEVRQTLFHPLGVTDVETPLKRE